MNIDNFKEIIKEVSEENGFVTHSEKNSEFIIDVDKYHSVSFLVKENSSGYLQVHQWESMNESEEGEWGRAVYSLRTISDVIQFCSIVLSSSRIYARR